MGDHFKAESIRQAKVILVKYSIKDNSLLAIYHPKHTYLLFNLVFQAQLVQVMHLQDRCRLAR